MFGVEEQYAKESNSKKIIIFAASFTGKGMTT
jgi:hypothetical protein